MTVLTDARPHTTAIKAAIIANLGGSEAAYTLDELALVKNDAKKLPNIYVEVHIERRASSVLRATEQAGSVGWRISLRCVGRTVAEVQWALHQVAVSLNEKQLTVSGVLTTPIQFENDEAPGLDDSRYSALARYTYAH